MPDDRDILDSAGSERTMRTYESRLASTEAVSRQNTEAIASLTHNVDRLSGEMVKGFREVRADIAGGQKTDWKVIGTFLGVLVAIGGLLYSFHGAEIGRIEKRADKADEAIVASAYAKGRADEARDTLRAAIADLQDRSEDLALRVERNAGDLDTRLQGEMRLVNATTEAKVTALDKRIQEEITRNAAERRQQLSELRDSVESISLFQRTASGIHADHAARLANLERKP